MRGIMDYFVGIDIGSTSAKTVVVDREMNILYKSVRPTGWSSIDTAEGIRKDLDAAGFMGSCIVVATGYGRVSVPFANKCITEITCHANGAAVLYNIKSGTVIDIGGQDTKVISLEAGMVKDFIMNDKCSAGTGRFLEVMANTLSLRPDELCELASKGGGISISSMCTVFAESEVISLIGRGEKKENIAFAVVDSIVKKVASQVRKLGLNGDVYLTGGLCECEYLIKALSAELKTIVVSIPDGRFAGAYGAAVSAIKNRR